MVVWTRVGKKFPDRILQKGVSLLRTKSRDNVGTEDTVGWPPDWPGRGDRTPSKQQPGSTFHVANFHNFKTKLLLEGQHQVIG